MLKGIIKAGRCVQNRTHLPALFLMALVCSDICHYNLSKFYMKFTQMLYFSIILGYTISSI